MPILRHILAQAPLPRAGVALDLACGPGLKAVLLAEALGPGVRLIGVDIDRDGLRAATGDRRPETRDRRPETKIVTQSSILDPRSSILDLRPLTRSPAHPLTGIVGDALALPLRDGCCDVAFCIAALGLFVDRLAALRELRRALRPGAPALLAVGTQAWAQVVGWPDDIAARLALAYAQALADGGVPIPATPDLGDELAQLLIAAGFAAPLVRAFWLDRPTTDHRRTTEQRTKNKEQRTNLDHGLWTTDDPLAAELPLLPWPALRVLLAGRLSAAELSRCDQLAAVPDVELCALALVALVHGP
jgi:SAM-dependent methyltransferase